MPRISREWGACITALLERHGLTPRGAMLKSEGVVSHTTIIEWMRGVVPIQIMDKAWPFLSAFPREEAVECLRAANLPIPPEWEATTDAVEAIDFALRGVELPEQGKEEIRQFVKSIREKYKQEAESQRQEN